jgi:hypothetical protein
MISFLFWIQNVEKCFVTNYLLFSRVITRILGEKIFWAKIFVRFDNVCGVGP